MSLSRVPFGGRWQAALMLATAQAAALTAACSSAPARPEPAPLEPIAKPGPGRQVWSANLGTPVQDVGTVERLAELNSRLNEKR